MYQTVVFPLYPDVTVFLAHFHNVAPATLESVKAQLLAKNPLYDYCFLNTAHIVSQEQLRSALHRAVQNMVRGTMRANTVYTEALFGLSPVNNLNDAFKRFGVDVTRGDVVAIKIVAEPIDAAGLDAIEAALVQLLASPAEVLCDETLYGAADRAKFRKLFKAAGLEETAAAYLKAAVAGGLLRGL